MVLSAWLGMFVGIELFMREILTIKQLLLIGGTLSVLGLLIASMSTAHLYLFTFGYAVLEEFGSGMSYMSPVICVWEWFPESKGKYGSFLIASCGFSVFMFSLLSTKLVNPDDKKATIFDHTTQVTYFDESVGSRVPYMLRFLALIYAVIILVSVTMISRRKKRSTDTIT